MRDFDCTVLADSTTAGTREKHETALWTMDTGEFATIHRGDRARLPPPGTAAALRGTRDQ